MKLTYRELFNIMLVRDSYKVAWEWDLLAFCRKHGYKNARELYDLEKLMNIEVENDIDRTHRNEFILTFMRGALADAKHTSFELTENGWKVNIEK